MSHAVHAVGNLELMPAGVAKDADFHNTRWHTRINQSNFSYNFDTKNQVERSLTWCNRCLLVKNDKFEKI